MRNKDPYVGVTDREVDAMEAADVEYEASLAAHREQKLVDEVEASRRSQAMKREFFVYHFPGSFFFDEGDPFKAGPDDVDE